MSQEIFRDFPGDLVVKTPHCWTFPVVQWLRIHLPKQEHEFDPCSGKIPHVLEQLSHNYWAQMTYSQCSATRQSHHNEKPINLKWREPTHSNQDPAHAK